MQSSSWIDMLRRFPPELQDILILRTSSGMEVNIQEIIRMEGDYLVIRGRPVGSTDAGQPFFVPYDQINYVRLNRALKIPELLALYGEPPAAAAAAAAPAPEVAAATAPEAGLPPAEESAVPAPEAPTAAPAPAPVPPPAAPAATPSPTPPPAPMVPPLRPPVAAKSAILERLRARGNPAAPKSDSNPSDKS
jgi:hypothetical protein